MKAIIQDGGHQYEVEPGKDILVQRKAKAEGEIIEFTQVLMLKGDQGIRIGMPTITGAKVIGEVLQHIKGKKIRVFKYKRRKGYHKTIGHRQRYTKVKIKEILAPG
jgi:large subunit ribosomal protein L21